MFVYPLNPLLHYKVIYLFCSIMEVIQGFILKKTSMRAHTFFVVHRIQSHYYWRRTRLVLRRFCAWYKSSSTSTFAFLWDNTFRNFFSEKTSTSARKTAITGRWSDRRSSSRPYFNCLSPLPCHNMRSHLAKTSRMFEKASSTANRYIDTSSDFRNYPWNSKAFVDVKEYKVFISI